MIYEVKNTLLDYSRIDAKQTDFQPYMRVYVPNTEGDVVKYTKRKRATGSTPPAFIRSTFEDALVPCDNSRLFASVIFPLSFIYLKKALTAAQQAIMSPAPKSTASAIGLTSRAIGVRTQDSMLIINIPSGSNAAPYGGVKVSTGILRYDKRVEVGDPL